MIDIPIVLDLVRTGALVAGIIFALAQLRQATRSRRDYAAAEVIRTAQTHDVRLAVARVLALPLDVEPGIIRADPSLLQAALAVDSVCEMWGSMVYEGVIPHRMLDRMVGGWVRGTWLRLRRWAAAERIDYNPNAAEWWQWLYDLLEDDPDPGKAQGAHITYRGRNRSR